MYYLYDKSDHNTLHRSNIILLLYTNVLTNKHKYIYMYSIVGIKCTARKTNIYHILHLTLLFEIIFSFFKNLFS